jgi:hypothetical protein
MNTQYIKNLLMTVIVAVGVLLTQSTFNLPVFVLTILGTALLYVGQHKLLPSTSPAFQLVLQDFLVAIFLGVGSALINAGSTFIIGGVICWGCLWKLTLSVALGYLTKTLPASAITGPIKTAVILLFLIFACNLQSQAQTKPFKGFFLPKSSIQLPKTLKATLGDATVTPTSVWKFRPAVFITGDAIKVSGGIAVTQPLSSIGTGVSYAKFISNNGLPYEQFSVSGLVMTNINLNGTALTTIGGGLIVGAFNGIVNVGGAYIGKQVYVLIGTKISL